MEYTIWDNGKVIEPHYHNIIHSIPGKPELFGLVVWMGFNKRCRVAELGIIHKLYEVDFTNKELIKTTYNFIISLKVIPGGEKGKLFVFKETSVQN